MSWTWMRVQPRRHTAVALAIAAGMLTAVWGRDAKADVVLNLVTTGSLSLTPSGTGTLAISVTNSGTGTVNLIGMTLGMQLVPDGGVTGSLTLADFLAAGTIWSNATVSAPTAATLVNGDLNGSSNYLSMTISGDSYTFAPSTTAVLGTVEFTASGDADGIWRLYVVNEWETDGLPISFTTEDETFAEPQFANLTATEGAPGVALQVGTIVAAVPEPSGLALLGAAAGIAGLRLVRRRR